MARKQGSIATGDTHGGLAPEAGFSPSPGYVVGDKYRIESLLGKGGMGAVYHSTHLVSGKRVALKWMLPTALATAELAEELAERFVREARATARIDHPNVVDIYDVGTQDGSVYLVMELLHGESLAERLERGPMEPTEAVSVLMHALRAVAAAHAQGVIHRDLKPDNIFLCEGPDGEPREPKVVDFGISKIVDVRDMSLTQSGMVMGTPYYMSPEQVRGLRDVDERGDVYAFGVILYEMLTGECPFDAETYNQLILKIVTEEPTPLASLRPDVDPKLAAVIARAMARNRDDRYPSVVTLALDLEPFAGGITFRRSSSLPGAQTPVSGRAPRGAQARTPLSAERSVPHAPRRRTQLAVIMLLALAAIGAGVWWRLAPHGMSETPSAFANRPSSEFAAHPAPATPAAAPAEAAKPVVVEGAPTPPAAAEANTALPHAAATTETAPHTTSRSSHRRTTEEPAAPAPAARRSLPADWDERLPTATPQPPARTNPAGTLGRDDL